MELPLNLSLSVLIQGWLLHNIKQIGLCNNLLEDWLNAFFSLHIREGVKNIERFWVGANSFFHWILKGGGFFTEIVRLSTVVLISYIRRIYALFTNLWFRALSHKIEGPR